MAAILTLLTDFGSADGYAGALKGAIARVAPQLRVVTITHGVPPHDIGAGAYWLGASAPAFPHGTVHCVVVDPGVGTDRPLVCARVDRQLVVAPDNGLLHFLWSRGQDRMAVRVDISGLDQSRISSTFHGRDLIGPLAARLAVGTSRFEDLGPKIPSPQLVSEFLPQGDSAGTTARVLVIDRFGNVILTVSRTPWYSPLPASVALSNGRVISALVRTYGEIDDDFAMLWNSADHLEIAGKGMSAAALLNLQLGDRVRVAWAAAAEPILEERSDRRSFAS
ncbi:MAG TPA: SAM-dependent chlorinase/fluorinase [Candidatus Dormibacteraeota bacterium]|nr:SAM-dependent chlorinase/fluorinase [Candidatus Dormibacteraeota bacterium]